MGMILIFLLAIGVPAAWFISEFQDRRALRLALGTVAILLSFAIGAVLGSVQEKFNLNAWFGNASKELVDVTITELEAGNQDGVLRALISLRKQYSPTYENRARYDELIHETVSTMQAGAKPTNSPGSR